MRCAELADRLVVRSSAVVESRGPWAGAFASYADMAPSEVHHGVKGCWASVFTQDALRRGEAAGVAPADVGMGVLVQPELRPDYGGVAKADPSGTVAIAGIAGPPAAIVSGWERGELIMATTAGVSGASARLGRPLVEAVARLGRDVRELLDRDHIEWAQSDGRLWLLQAQSGVRGGQSPTQPPSSALTEDDPRLDVLAYLLASYPGEAGEELVLSWAAGLRSLASPARPSEEDPALLLAMCRDRISLLGPSGEARSVRSLLRALSTEPAPSLDRLLPSTTVDAAQCARQLGLVEALASGLALRGSIPASGWLGHLDTAELQGIVAGARLDPKRRFGVGRWEPLLYRIVRSRGIAGQGMAAAPGWGAGRIRVIRDEGDAELFGPREVVAARYPVNNLAPLLWDAAGLVTIGGSPGAHLFEVASWLGVPSVCGVDLEGLAGQSLDTLSVNWRLLAAVDGASGSVTLLST